MSLEDDVFENAFVNFRMQKNADRIFKRRVLLFLHSQARVHLIEIGRFEDPLFKAGVSQDRCKLGVNNDLSVVAFSHQKDVVLHSGQNFR